MKTIKKALIPAAGLGTRFLPATKSVPKEMLPIVDKPALLYIVEEAVHSGVEDIVIIAGRNKTAIENFFDASVELEALLEKTEKLDLLEEIKAIKNMANIISLRQKEALGLGHAVYCGKPVIGEEPFAVLLGDEIMLSQDQPATAQLVHTYEQQQCSVVSVMEVHDEDMGKYGIVEYDDENNGLYSIKNVIEKPEPLQTTSRLALPGRYVFTSELFKHLENLSPGRNNEIQLTDGMTELAQKQKVLGQKILGQRYDIGHKLGFLQANIEFGLRDKQINSALKGYLKDLKENL